MREIQEEIDLQSLINDSMSEFQNIHQEQKRQKERERMAEKKQQARKRTAAMRREETTKAGRRMVIFLIERNKYER